MTSGPSDRDPVSRGPLYPARLPSLHRLSAPEAVSWAVRWFWIPEWDIDAGCVSRQHILPYPGCNLVVESGSVSTNPTDRTAAQVTELVGISGPATKPGYRDLRGRGWAVGALLRPAAVTYLVGDLAAITDGYTDFDAPRLRRAVVTAMHIGVDEPGGVDGDTRRMRAVRVFSDWLADTLPAPQPEDLVANAYLDLVESDRSLMRVDDVADRLGVSVRTLQRLSRNRIGISPAALIRRRRLQEAAEQLRTDTSTSIADVAAALGYTDHAHLAAEFRSVLGLGPSEYRRTQ